ncbi:) transport protein [Dionaea muscipula]
MAELANNVRVISLLFLVGVLLSVTVFQAAEAKSEEEAAECTASRSGACHNKSKSLRLNYIAIGCILVASVIGVSLPLFTRAVPALHPEKDLFLLVKSFASGVIIATGFMHVMPDSWNDLTSPCLPDAPWRVFPFTPFITMIAAYLTMMMDTFSTAFYEKTHLAAASSRDGPNGNPAHSYSNGNGNGKDEENAGRGHDCGHGHGHGHGQMMELMFGDKKDSDLMKNRVVAQVLELGIVVHSVVIGLSMGASDNYCTIQPLVIAICFHQLFEGMGLGGCITQAEYEFKMKAIMVFFFSVTTPGGIVLGILLQHIYDENSPTALIVVGVLNAISAGLLIYMALVDLLAAEFKGPKLQRNMKLQLISYVVALLGTGLMSLMAKWA